MQEKESIKGVHCELKILSVRITQCMASISEPRDAEQLSSIRNFQSPPQNIMDSYSPNLLATLTFWVTYHSNMTLTFSPLNLQETICENSRYQPSAC